MPERFREILDKIIEWWKKFTNKQRIVLISIISVVILALVILAVVITRPNMVELIACSDAAQAAEVKQILEEESSISYTIDDNMVVRVESADLAEAEMLLGKNSIPSKGYSLESATSGGFSSTSADKDRLYQKYLEDKFEDRLSNLKYVKSATVDITLPEKDGTILSKDKEGTAAITLDLKEEIDDDKAYAIARFVATEIGNETVKGITIIDSKSNVLFSGTDSESNTGLATSQLKYKSMQEEMIKKQISDALTESGVFSNIEIAIQLNIDFSKKQEAKREWSIPEGRNESLMDSASLYSSSSKNGLGGTPGTDSNDGTSYMTKDNNYSEQTIEDNDYDYLNDEKVTKTESNGGRVDYENSSVSVIATRYIVYDQKVLEENGTLDDTSWEQFKQDNGDTKRVTEVDEDMVGVIANSTGFSTSKISFLVYETPKFIDKKGSNFSVTDIFQILLAVLIFALLGFVVFKSTRSEKSEEMEPELSVESLLESTAEANEHLNDIGYTEKSEVRILIEKFVDENPDAVALLLRNWLNEDWE